MLVGKSMALRRGNAIQQPCSRHEDVAQKDVRIQILLELLRDGSTLRHRISNSISLDSLSQRHNSIEVPSHDTMAPQLIDPYSLLHLHNSSSGGVEYILHSAVIDILSSGPLKAREMAQDTTKGIHSIDATPLSSPSAFRIGSLSGNDAWAATAAAIVGCVIFLGLLRRCTIKRKSMETKASGEV
jgi:hypothetical protein